MATPLQTLFGDWPEESLQIVDGNHSIKAKLFKNLSDSAYGDWVKVGRAKSGFCSDRWPNPHKRINGFSFYSCFVMPTVFYTSHNLGKVALSEVQALWTGQNKMKETYSITAQAYTLRIKRVGENHLRFEHCPAQIASIPAVDTQSKVEQQAGIRRWSQFTAEMTKPDPYGCKYKIELVKVQIPPNIQIDDCAALFFNPYEGLTHTLDDGPANDGILMAQLFISKGYNVVYLCDATHHEYYKWMHWLLTNVGKEIVSYFQGDGTQVADKTGKEKDGKFEVFAFYNAKKKKATTGQKITAVKGITNEIIQVVNDDILKAQVFTKDTMLYIYVIKLHISITHRRIDY
ncbi:MAG: hypothetical protein EZS28_033747 [Streblomastix strix]|uniref:Uncharacterized protein n=1 Tax=Streblomastix strix TaxID=222440 RepID=A0A5J4UIW1_9EUKA|nr:MAG: hypothetical protein EZS28_033747 [Streblomastix strix]